MISLKVLSTAAAMALVLPIAVSTASFAQDGMVHGPNGVRITAGAAGVQPGGGGGGASQRMVGGPGGVRITAGAAGMQPGGGGRQFTGGGGGRQFSGGGGGQQFSGGGGGGYRGGYGGGYRHDHDGDRGGGGFIPGAVAGAVIGGAIASQGYYGGPGYYQPGYYDDQYYDDSAVAVAPVGGDGSVAYCMQTYRSYDPQSGTYLGNDGYRHPCP